MTTFEGGLDTIQALVDSDLADGSSRDRNEAQTRKDLIDALIASLGWEASDIRVESHYDGTYADYELGRDGSRLLIEAKREGVYFELPAGWSDRVARLSTVSGTSSKIESALRQAAGYAQSRGIQYAAVSNGWQVIAFLASRTDGVPPLEGKALVFPDISAWPLDFRLMWDNLSNAGVAERNLSRTLGSDIARPPLPRLSKKIGGYPGVAQRTPEEQTLQILGSVFVEDIASREGDERRFLISCYAASGALSQYALLSKEILRTRYSLLFDDGVDIAIQPASTHTGLDKDLLSDIAAASLKHRPIILLGDVGVGKSTFIKNLIHVEAREQLETALVFYLDFGKRPALATDLPGHVAAELERQLNTVHNIDIRSDAFVRGVYHGKLEQFETGIYGPLRSTDPQAYLEREIEFLSELVHDTDEHLRSSLDHISRAHRKQIVVFLDNIDQRDSGFQDDLFVIGQTMAESWPVTVFLALRPETFHESRRSGSLAAYQPRAFSIAPPRVEIVLKRRLAYALELLREGGLRTGTGVEILVDLDTLIRFVDIVQRSLKTRYDLVEFLENVSNGNIREALGYLEQYIGSPHVNMKRILEIVRGDNSSAYIIPIQDLVKAVGLGDSQYYDPSRSPFGNIFDASSLNPSTHFLTPIIVERLGDGAVDGSHDGFVEVGELYRYCQSLGFTADEVADALERALAGRLISQAGLDRSRASVARAFRSTSAGVYATRRLARMFAYVDLLIDDCPILDPGKVPLIVPLTHRGSLLARLDRADAFAEYLTECWQALSGSGSELRFDWAAVEVDLRADIRRVRSKVSQGQR